jgi:arsenite methyltransferase
MNVQGGAGCRLYESEHVRSVCGETIRPGGYDLTRRAVALCGGRKGQSLLDIGCGNGASMAFIRDNYGMAVLGIDASEKMIHEGRKKSPGLPICLGAAEHLSFQNESMDIVLTECSMSHFSDDLAVLKEICRVLKPSGHMIVADMYVRKSDLSDDAVHKATRLRTKIDILQRVSAIGYEPALWEDHTQALMQLTVDIIMQYGSVSNFYALASPDCADQPLLRPMNNIKKGYYLLTARKSRTNICDGKGRKLT